VTGRHTHSSSHSHGTWVTFTVLDQLAQPRPGQLQAPVEGRRNTLGPNCPSYNMSHTVIQHRKSGCRDPLPSDGFVATTVSRRRGKRITALTYSTQSTSASPSTTQVARLFVATQAANLTRERRAHCKSNNQEMCNGTVYPLRTWPGSIQYCMYSGSTSIITLYNMRIHCRARINIVFH